MSMDFFHRSRVLLYREVGLYLGTGMVVSAEGARPRIVKPRIGGPTILECPIKEMAINSCRDLSLTVP